MIALAAPILGWMGCESDARIAGVSESPDGVVALRWGRAGDGLVFGEGTLEEGQLHLEIPGSPPPAAFRGSVAVGELVLLPPGSEVRLGQPLRDELGTSNDLAVVYRVGESSEFVGFPVGVSCARRSGGSYERIWCEGLSVRFGDPADP